MDTGPKRHAGHGVLAALLTDIRAKESANRAEIVAWRLVHLACVAMAMFSKESGIVVPLVVLVARRRLTDAASSGRGEGHEIDDTLRWAGWAATLGVFAWARHHALVAGLAETAALHLAGTQATPPIDWMTPIRHASIFIQAAGKVLLPIDLAPLGSTSEAPWSGGVALIALGVAGLVAHRSGRLRGKVLAFGVCVYGSSLVPTLVVGGSLALESRLYLPAVGVVIALCALVDSVRLERSASIAGGAAVLLVFGVLSVGYSGAYADPLAFGKAAVAGAPRSALAHFTLGQARQMRGEFQSARDEYARALDENADEPIVRNNLAVIYMRDGEWLEAERELEAELRVNPEYPVALENLQVVRRHLERHQP